MMIKKIRTESEITATAISEIRSFESSGSAFLQLPGAAASAPRPLRLPALALLVCVEKFLK